MPPSHSLGTVDGSAVLAKIVSDFGREVTRKLRSRDGSPEDHLRGPFERMLASAGAGLGLTISTIGETRLPDLSIRPDFAVDVAGSRVGYVELKRPGHGVPGKWSHPSRHDRDQWKKLQLLPNVLYADGEQFARYSFGKRHGRIAQLAPGLDRAGSNLRAVGTDFARVLTDFLLWEPERPRSLDELVRLVANLCRLLRDDVAAEIENENAGRSRGQTFTGLATDWRQILFPKLTDQQFSDQYAQTVSFALLLARVDGVSFQGRSIGEIARLLGKKHSLMGRALTVLTDQPEEEHSVALTTMTRVISVVDWSVFPEDSYAVLYERFLAEYDPRLRRQSGVYYTPSSLVSFMTRFVDETLRIRLGRQLGFADRDVIVVDPAMGTGSFLAEVVDAVAKTVEAEEGPGAVAPQLRDLSKRLIGFENQAAPYAVAELRIHSLLKKRHRAEIPVEERRFLADTLDDPGLQQLPLGRMYEAIARSRRGADEVKRRVPVMVVIGNPPFVDKVKGIAEWIEVTSSNRSSPSIAAFRKPGNGRLEYVLSNLYVYFWRWATWKAFDAHPDHPAGVIALVCSSGFTTGPGFAGMREYLRRTTDEGWIIDLTPEGHQPPMATRYFRGTQQPICIGIFTRYGNPQPETPAKIHYTAVSGTTKEKTAALDTLGVNEDVWQECDQDWIAPLRPRRQSVWDTFPAMTELLPWTAPGIKPNRTWVYAPEKETLLRRWDVLVRAPSVDKPELLKETSSTRADSNVSPVRGMDSHNGPISAEHGPCPDLRRVAHRSFDRKWVIPDARLHHRPSPSLWASHAASQIYVVEQHAHPISIGPSLIFTSDIPDMDCHSGRGGRVLPLYRDGRGTAPNVAPGLLEFLRVHLTTHIDESDLIAYIAAVTAHPAFTRRFHDDLRRPGVRIPVTRKVPLWTEAVDLGREAVWLHTYGERFADPTSGRPSGSPRLRRPARPVVRARIPDTQAGMPERMTYDEDTLTLHVGEGTIAPVAPEVWTYEVSGMSVLKHWFGYRKRKPAGQRSSPLDDIVPKAWSSTMTTELLELLNVLGRCVSLEPRQESLLDRIMGGPVITVDDLADAGLLPVPEAARRARRPEPVDDLFAIPEAQ